MATLGLAAVWFSITTAVQCFLEKLGEMFFQD